MLSARRAVVIEEEALVVLDIQDILNQHGVTDVVHYRSIDEAAPHAEHLLGVDLAIVEAHLGAAEVVAFTRQLVEAGVSTVVMSADHAAPQLFPHTVALAKPFDADSLVAACAEAAGKHQLKCGVDVT